MKNREELEKDIIQLISTVVPRGIKKKQITHQTDFRLELGFDSICLFNLVYLIEQKYEINLFNHVERLAEAKIVLDILEITYDIYKDENMVSE